MSLSIVKQVLANFSTRVESGALNYKRPTAFLIGTARQNRLRDGDTRIRISRLDKCPVRRGEFDDVQKETKNPMPSLFR